MSSPFLWQILALALLLSPLYVESLRPIVKKENGMKSAVYLSPMFELGPGDVENKFHYGIDFPTGHIALKEFNAEVVDEMGNAIPLYETYLHHWSVRRAYGRKGIDEVYKGNQGRELLSQLNVVKNSGTCTIELDQYFGLGSENRQTATYVPDPYGIEVGNPKLIPEGYEEKWLLHIHAIDTRGVDDQDRLGCIECRCDLYNVTIDEHGRPLKPDYTGGSLCCYDQTQCKVKQGFTSSIKRKLYVRYSVKWVDWDDSIVPVKIYILDVTDDSDQTTPGPKSGCKVEYNVEACDASAASSNGCIENRKTRIVMPKGGHVIYGVAHQHAGGIGSALYGEDGRVICSSTPIYGKGNEPGNEDGFIVGMTTCYPRPGSVKILDGEALVLESNYSSIQMHYGVMGFFYLMVAEQPQILQFPLEMS